MREKTNESISKMKQNLLKYICSCKFEMRNSIKPFFNKKSMRQILSKIMIFLIPIVPSYLSLVIAKESLEDSTRKQDLITLIQSFNNYKKTVSQRKYIFSLEDLNEDVAIGLEDSSLKIVERTEYITIESLIKRDNSYGNRLKQQLEQFRSYHQYSLALIAADKKLEEIEELEGIANSDIDTLRERYSELIQTKDSLESKLNKLDFSEVMLYEALKKYYEEENVLINRIRWFFIL